MLALHSRYVHQAARSLTRLTCVESASSRAVICWFLKSHRARTFKSTAWILSTAPIRSVGTNGHGSVPQNIHESTTYVSDGHAVLAPVPRTIDDFTARVKDGTADIVTARQYLQLSQDRVADLSLEEKRRKVAAAGAGRVLEWLWTARGRATWESDLTAHTANLLCWHLEAEGLDRYIWEWLEIELQDARSTEPTLWTKRVLTSYITAKLDWYPECADPALGALLEANSKGYLTTRSRTPWLLVRSILCREGVRSCSEQLYDQYCEAEWDLRENNKSPFSSGARLQLYHPTKPSADNLLQRYRACDGTQSGHLWRRTPRQHDMMLLRAHYVLLLQGRDDDAQWLSEQLQLPKAEKLQLRNEMDQMLQRDPRLNGLRQQHQSRLQKVASPL